MRLGGGLGHARVSLGPQQQAVRVGEHREVTGILGDLPEELTHDGHDGRERMGVQPFSRLVLVEQAAANSSKMPFLYPICLASWL